MGYDSNVSEVQYVILEVPSMLDLEVRLRISTVEYCTLSAGNGLAIGDMNYNCAFKCGETASSLRYRYGLAWLLCSLGG